MGNYIRCWWKSGTQNKVGSWEGRWSNGPVAVDVLADRLKVGLTDYAVVGAMSGYGDYLSEMSDLDLLRIRVSLGQIDKYETELDGKKADPGSLHFIEIGLVDISSKLEKKSVNSDRARGACRRPGGWQPERGNEHGAGKTGGEAVYGGKLAGLFRPPWNSQMKSSRESKGVSSPHEFHPA